MAETIRAGESATQFTIRRIRNEILEEAATECERHGNFCEDEAKAGGDGPYLRIRAIEAFYNAKRIRDMKDG